LALSDSASRRVLSSAAAKPDGEPGKEADAAGDGTPCATNALSPVQGALAC